MELVKNRCDIILSKRQQLIIILRALWILSFNDNTGLCYCIRTALFRHFRTNEHFYDVLDITYFNRDNLEIYNLTVERKYKSTLSPTPLGYWWNLKNHKARVKYLLWLFKVTRKNL